MKLGPIRLLVVVNLMLAGGLAWMWLDQHGQWRNVTWTAPAALLPELNSLTATGVPPGPQVVNPTQYLAILERPVFAPDRRPPPPPAPPPPPDPMADVQITGIFSGPSGGGVLARVEGAVRRIKINDAIGAWSLKSISGREVTFVQGEQTRQLRLEYTRLGVAPAHTNPQAPGIVRAAGGIAPSAAVSQNNQDEMRERLRRRNEIRAARGLPPVTD